MIRFTSVDLPTLGRPTTARTGTGPLLGAVAAAASLSSCSVIVLRLLCGRTHRVAVGAVRPGDGPVGVHPVSAIGLNLVGSPTVPQSGARRTSTRVWGHGCSAQYTGSADTKSNRVDSGRHEEAVV